MYILDIVICIVEHFFPFVLLSFGWYKKYFSVLMCTCVCVASAWPQLQSGGAGSQAEEAGGDVPVGGVPGEQVSLLYACQHSGLGQVLNLWLE